MISAVDGCEDWVDFAIEAVEEDKSVGFKTAVVTFNFPSKVTPGCLITIVATAPFGIARFSIDVYGSESNENKDIIFHFNPRMPLKYVVRNSNKNSTWGREETTSYRPFPFEYGRPFTLEILASDTEWLVAVDSELYCSFKHRIALENCSHLEVVGLTDPGVTITQTDIFPIPSKDRLVIPHFESDLKRNNPTLNWPSNPRAFLDHVLKEGEQLVVKGKLRIITQSFIVELTDGIQEWPHVQTILHVNPRLIVSSNKPLQTVVMNTLSKGIWGQERKQYSGKFVPGQYVELRIVREAKEWTVWHERTQIGAISHILDPEMAKAVRIKGDLYPKEIYTTKVES